MLATRTLVLTCLAALLTLALACADSTAPAVPVAPTGSVLKTNSDGSVVKVTAPTPTAPANNSTLAQGVISTQLQATTATAQFSSTPSLTYRFEVYKGASIAGSAVATLFTTPTSSVATVNTGSLSLLTLYAWRVRAESGGAPGPWSSTQTFTTGGELRRDANAFGGKIPRSVAIADLNATVFKVAAANPVIVQETCLGPVDGVRDNRNDINFPLALLTVLRSQFDNRWGFNCIRGNCSDPAAKVVTYHWAPGPSEGSISVYVFQVISGACQAEVADVTDVTFGAGTVGRYSLLGKFTPNNPDF